ncbi:Re/Si-specific NAD(P)(+) transhydrogenase subunit alpha [candidate division KSB1 bacterium]|nr:Re/Si-specific NAD(P)(+) transhydrogenase subunit alpha [candidate division KSB1 bacterium]
MKIGIPEEIYAGETRVAVVPAMINVLTKMGHDVLVQAGAGERASFSDAMYLESGAKIVNNASELFSQVDVLLKVQPPQIDPVSGKNEIELLRDGAAVIGFQSPLSFRDNVNLMKNKKITAFAMEFVPRITRAQSMDALSSMATIAGYKSVLMAADHLGKMFPLLMTAAGTIPPANVLILGAGVAGLQAIATAKRLGARVEAFDPRPAVKEQVLSLGAQFVEMELPKDAETAGGYAKELPEDFLKREQDAIGARLPKIDVVITTAQIFGKKAPLLITEKMVKSLKPGSVIVDLAAEQGGNCELTTAGQVVEKYGVYIMGPVNLPAQIPIHASQMYSKNITNLVKHLYASKDGMLDFNDEITKGACMTYMGEITNELVKNSMQTGG